MISLTETATNKMRNQLMYRGQGLGIRIAVKTTGCSGLSYVMEYVDELGPGDDTVLFEGFAVVINKRDQPYLQGLEIDYVKQGLNEGYRFNNPNEKARCGCGESFTV